MFGMLMNNFREEFYWWEVVILLKKMIYVILVDLTNQFNNSLRAFLISIFFLACIFVENILSPFKPERAFSHNM
jgi:hypothetical protein